MLKLYSILDDVPEALREHYKLIEGKYVPEITDDHPVKVNNVQLLNEKNAAETKAAGLETELSQAKTALTGAQADLVSAKAGGLPRGHVAVPKADAELLEQVKAQGGDAVAKLTEYTTLKEDSERRTRENHLRKVAKVLGYDNEEAFVRLPGLPELEIRTVAGKETVIAKVKDGDSDVEKPAQEFIESSTEIAPFLSALKTQPAIRGAKADPKANGHGNLLERDKRAAQEARRAYRD